MEEPRQTPTARGDESTRKRLLDAGRELFTAHGFRGTSTREIAAKAGCNLSLIKYYFGSKEGLLRQVVRPEIEAVRTLIESMDSGVRPSPERLRQFFLGMARQLDANRHFFRLIFAELLRDDSPVGPELLEPIRRNQQAALRVLHRAKDHGMLRDVDLQASLLVVMGSLMFYQLAYPVASQLVGPRSTEVIDRIAATAADIFLHGILKEPGAGEQEGSEESGG
jgi:AcrR family transcriptional regulator